MSYTAASVTQADIARILRAAWQTGARAVDIKLPDGTTVRVSKDEPVEITTAPLAAHKEIVL